MSKRRHEGTSVRKEMGAFLGEPDDVILADGGGLDMFSLTLSRASIKEHRSEECD